nr:MAG TPA: hypothetical protein [Caudoviricetes sp.]
MTTNTYGKKYNEYIKNNLNEFNYLNDEIERKRKICDKSIDKIDDLIDKFKHDVITYDELYAYIQQEMTSFIFGLNNLTMCNQNKEAFEFRANLYATEESVK